MSTAIARVYVNDIEVGALPADLYKKIVKDVYADRRLYVHQAANYLWAAFRLVANSFQIIPYVYLIALFLAEVLSPSIVSTFIGVMRQATPAEMNNYIWEMLGVGLLFSMLVLLFSMTLSKYPSGITDKFAVQINHRIRSLLEVPSEGALRVIFVSGDDSNEQ
jgi:hypothetical protein